VTVGDLVPGWSARPRPSGGPFAGRFCTVVPLEQDHAAGLFTECAEPGDDELWTYMSDGPFPGERSFTAWVARIVADAGSVPVAVLDTAGRPGGLARFMRVDCANGVVEIGGIVWGRSLRRTPAATEAIHLVAAHAFEDLGYRRLEWKCDALNAPSRSAALRLGFTYEGCFRNHVVVKGRNRDTAWYAITSQEWPGVAAAHRRWLDPANFDPEGRQRQRLTVPHSGTRSPDPGTAGTLA
jgi:RimJ/RimL family protein N-acetyltransferase